MKNTYICGECGRMVRVTNEGVEVDFDEKSISFHGKSDLIQLDEMSYFEAKLLSIIFGDMADALKREGK